MIHEPKKLTCEQKNKIIERRKYVINGGSISCGHDFWDHAKTKPAGDIFLCTRCCQYFVKMNGMPWWIEGREHVVGPTYKFDTEPHSNHMDGTWFHPVDFRLQDGHGNTIEK